jgi:hypothetical protein
MPHLWRHQAQLAGLGVALWWFVLFGWIKP